LNFLLLSPARAQEYLGLSRHLFDQEVRPHVKEYAFGRRIYYRRKDIEDFVDKHRMENQNYGGTK